MRIAGFIYKVFEIVLGFSEKMKNRVENNYNDKFIWF